MMSPRSNLFAFILIVSALVGRSSSAPFPSPHVTLSVSQSASGLTPVSAPGDVGSTLKDQTNNANQLLSDPAPSMSSPSGGGLNSPTKSQGSDDKSSALATGNNNLPDKTSTPNTSETTSTTSPNNANPTTGQAEDHALLKVDKAQETNPQPPEAVHGKRDEGGAPSPEKKSDAGLEENPSQLKDALGNTGPTADRSIASSLPSAGELDASKSQGGSQSARSDPAAASAGLDPKSGSDGSGLSTHKGAQPANVNSSPAGSWLASPNPRFSKIYL